MYILLHIKCNYAAFLPSDLKVRYSLYRVPIIKATFV
jgi:hypothetical protein